MSWETLLMICLLITRPHVDINNKNTETDMHFPYNAQVLAFKNISGIDRS